MNLIRKLTNMLGFVIYSIWIKRVLVSLLFLALCLEVNLNFAQGKTPMSPIQAEIKEVSFSNTSKVDITPIVKKYIQIKMPKEQTLSFLKSAEFEVHEILNKHSKESSEQSYVAVCIYETKAASHKEARIWLKFNVLGVSEISGFAFYHSL